MASLGGILKIFMMIFLYLNTIFSKVEKNISIVNEVFILNKKSLNSIVDKQPYVNIENSINNSVRISEKNNLWSDVCLNYKKLNNFSNVNIHCGLRNIRKNNLIKINPSISLIKNENLNKTANLGTSNVTKNIKRLENSLQENNLDNQSKMKKYLELRRSKTKLNFSFKDVMNIICNNYCKKKIPNSLVENFNFYEKAKNSVEHYFDFIIKIKKFQEIKIIKKCLFTLEQSKMINMMNRPVLSSKGFQKNRKSMQKGEDDQEFIKNVDCFLKRMKNNNKIDRNIMKIIEKSISQKQI